MKDFDLVTCRECKVVKYRKSTGNYTYCDEVGGRWRYRCCPPCSKKYQVNYRKVNNLRATPVSNNCLICKKSYIKKNSSSVYCSLNCRSVRNKNYYHTIKKSKRTYTPRVIKDYNCLLCFKVVSSKTIKRFCSKTCYYTYQNKNKKLVQKIITPRTCVYCSKEYVPIINKGKYCSDICCKRSYRKRHRKKRRAYNKLRDAKLLKRVPKWANSKKIEDIYKTCPPNYHVDHIIPLNGENVCGFHVEYNLQHLSAEENIIKSNEFDGTYDNISWKNKLTKTSFL